jgi:hypothetical protein
MLTLSREGEIMRRAVTGHSPEGKAIFLSDGEPARMISFENFPVLKQGEMWATSPIPVVPENEADPTPGIASLVPGPGETRFRILRFPSKLEIDRAIAGGTDWKAFAKEYIEKAPGLAEAHEPDGSGMHKTKTVDYGIVLSGHIWLELDDGMKKKFNPGDCIIQNATRHRWINEDAEPCFMAFIMIGTM